MSIEQGLTNTFLTEALQGYHAFSTAPLRAVTTADVFKLALYTSSASLGPTTTAYSATNEVPNSGTYTAGGGILTISTPPTFAAGTTTYDPTAYLTFSPISFTTATITARGALIYNSSQGNRTVAVLDFGSNKIAVAQTFTVTFPAGTPTTALVRITR